MVMHIFWGEEGGRDTGPVFCFCSIKSTYATPATPKLPPPSFQCDAYALLDRRAFLAGRWKMARTFWRFNGKNMCSREGHTNDQPQGKPSGNLSFTP